MKILQKSFLNFLVALSLNKFLHYSIKIKLFTILFSFLIGSCQRMDKKQVKNKNKKFVEKQTTQVNVNSLDQLSLIIFQVMNQQTKQKTSRL
jgi:uncharacterized membrane protein YczE